MNQPAFDFTAPLYFDPRSAAVAPSPHREARETSALAAIENTASRPEQLDALRNELMKA